MCGQCPSQKTWLINENYNKRHGKPPNESLSCGPPAVLKQNRLVLLPLLATVIDKVSTHC